jgi:hypothetical protein
MAALDIGNPSISCDVCHRLYAYFFEIFPDQPDLTCEVKVSQNVNGVLGDVTGVSRSHKPGHGITGGLVSCPFIALEALGLYRENRNSLVFGGFSADGFKVISYEADDTGRIDKGGFGFMQVNQFIEGFSQFFFATKDDVNFLEVGGKRKTVQLRAGGECPPDIPGVDGAADGAMYQMEGVGDGIEYNTGSTKNAGSLADRTSKTLLVAIQLKRSAAFDVNLF